MCPGRMEIIKMSLSNKRKLQLVLCGKEMDSRIRGNDKAGGSEILLNAIPNLTDAGKLNSGSDFLFRC